MPADLTPRLNLPFIQPGQAQKELSHNEALALIDLLLQPAVVALGRNTPPTYPEPGEAWIIGGTPTEAWAGRANAVAGWTPGGWRYVTPREGMAFWVAASGGYAQFVGGSWSAGQVRGASLVLGGQAVVGSRRAAIPDATGGTTADAEARTAINALLAAMRAHGLIDA